MVSLLDRSHLKGYLNPLALARAEGFDLLTPEGEHVTVAMPTVKSVYFVREFPQTFQPERKVFLSRPKLDGLWVRRRRNPNFSTNSPPALLPAFRRSPRCGSGMPVCLSVVHSCGAIASVRRSHHETGRDRG